MPTFLTSPSDSPADPASPHIVLVGLPGSGKSTVGALLGAALNRAFLDFDAEIEQRLGMPVAQIFAERGEAGFRRLERELTVDLSVCGGMVLAPGGGWVSQPEVVAMLRPPALMAYLRVSPAAALTRLADATTRPLLDVPDPLGALKRLLAARLTAYEAADVAVSTEHLTPQQVAGQIATYIHGRSTGRP